MSTSIPAPNVSFFTPMQDPPAGAALEHQPNNKPIPTLFQPLTVRGLTFHNRIFVCYISMCQYSAKDGFITPWHFGHLGGIFTRGPGLSIVEATAIVPEGRITPDDVGIWSDAHTENLKPLVEYAHSQNQKIAIQIGHAGRKASTMAPWIGGNSHAGKESGGWPDNIVGASAIPFDHNDPTPRELSEDELKGIVRAFKDAAIRAAEAGFDVIEIHGAHGYLLSSFLSPTSNHRTDDYGGSFENRIRFPLEVVDAIRSAIPKDMPLFFRLSGSEDIEQSLPDTPSWRIEDTVRFAPILHKHGVDFLDLSSGGLHPKQKHAPASFGPAYQVRFAEAVKRAVPNLIVGCVGRITNGHVAQDILDKGQADAVLVGRGFLKNPGLVWAFADDLGVEVNQAHQISWGFMGRKKEKENAT